MLIGQADTRQQVAIVAELGNNHEGDASVARELVHAAAAAGADAVKFQAIEPDELVHPDETARLAQLERFRLAPEQYAELAQLAHSLGIGFVCTPFSLPAVEWLTPLVDVFKIASGDNDYVALLQRVAASGRPVVVSSGMTDPAGIRSAKDIVLGAGAAELAVLHCVSAYPAPASAARLATIPVLAHELGCTVGYSDHTLGIEACITAVALGARILEKHFTLSHDFSDFRDHQLSAEPAELRELVERVAEVQQLVGSPREAAVLPEEEAVAAAARRSAVAACDLGRGAVLREGDVRFLRPAGPVGPAVELVGRSLQRDVRQGERLTPDDLAPRS